MSFTLSQAVITHNTTQFLDFISTTLDIVFSLRIHFGFITTHGIFGQINANGPCFNSHVEYASACI
ncbi:MAG: hypothetical protein Q8S84_07615 [bacterium]|nr:hypothetical protein [bacterium]